MQVVVRVDGRLQVEFVSGNKTWIATTDAAAVSVNYWHHVQLSWHEDKGIQVYIDKTRKASEIEEHVIDASTPPSFNYNVHIGWLTADLDIQSTVRLDDIEFWFADRDHLQAFGFLEDGIWVSFQKS